MGRTFAFVTGLLALLVCFSLPFRDRFTTPATQSDVAPVDQAQPTPATSGAARARSGRRSEAATAAAGDAVASAQIAEPAAEAKVPAGSAVRTARLVIPHAADMPAALSPPSTLRASADQPEPAVEPATPRIIARVRSELAAPVRRDDAAPASPPQLARLPSVSAAPAPAAPPARPLVATAEVATVTATASPRRERNRTAAVPKPTVATRAVALSPKLAASIGMAAAPRPVARESVMRLTAHVSSPAPRIAAVRGPTNFNKSDGI